MPSPLRIAHYQPADNAPAELTAVVDELLGQLSTKFSSISSEMLAKSNPLRSDTCPRAPS